MGKFQKEGLSGLAGNIVFYVTKNGQYFRTQPAKKPKKRNRKIIPTRQAFAKASRFGSTMIEDFKKYLPFHFSNYPYNKGRGWIRNQFVWNPELLTVSESVKQNIQVQLNEYADLRAMLRVSPSIEHRIETDKKTKEPTAIFTIQFPAFDPVKTITAPFKTRRVILQVAITTCNFEGDAGISWSGNTTQVIEYKPGLQTPDPMEIRITDFGATAMVVTALQYEVNKELVREERWLPGAGIAFGRIE